MRSLLNQKGYEQSILVGPEANHIGDELHSGETYVKDFLNSAADCIEAVTWHQYYLNGREATVQDFLNPKTFNRLPLQIETMKSILNSSQRDINTWLCKYKFLKNLMKIFVS